ncbi:uncharacterized protein [Ptychodera flava]|uniref:uncharacterized protein n=1 Tax=Ptychodera flava TaxID=63121 RepID=UPI00396A6A7C
MVSRTRKFNHITPVLINLHWLPVVFRIQYKSLLITYKALHDSTPTYISDLIHCKPVSRTLRSNDKDLLHVPQCRLKTYGERAFSRAAPLNWNNLPLEIRQSSSLDNFKKSIKTHLFERAY